MRKVNNSIDGLTTFGDSYEIPVGFGVLQNLTRHFDLGLRFSFDNLLGHDTPNLGRADTRSLALRPNDPADAGSGEGVPRRRG